MFWKYECSPYMQLIIILVNLHCQKYLNPEQPKLEKINMYLCQKGAFHRKCFLSEVKKRLYLYFYLCLCHIPRYQYKVFINEKSQYYWNKVTFCLELKLSIFLSLGKPSNFTICRCLSVTSSRKSNTTLNTTFYCKCTKTSSFPSFHGFTVSCDTFSECVSHRICNFSLDFMNFRCKFCLLL